MRIVPLLLAACASTAADAVPRQRPALGVTIDAQAGFDGGLAVQTVAAGSAAEVMGVHVGDRIVAAQGRALGEAADLAAALDALPPGDPLDLSVMRDGQRLELHGAPRPVPAPGDLAKTLDTLEKRLDALQRRPPPDERREAARLASALDRLETDQRGARDGLRASYPSGDVEMRLNVRIASDADADTPSDLLPPHRATATP
jgi:hypothetical protein